MTITASRFPRLRRFALLGPLAVIVVVIGWLAMVMAGDKYHWAWTEIPAHYRLSFGVEVAGIPHSGASVVRVTYEQVPAWQAWAWIDARRVDPSTGVRRPPCGYPTAKYCAS
jgi:hypothetical protein